MLLQKHRRVGKGLLTFGRAIDTIEIAKAKIPGARYICLPGLGHMPNLEAPQAFDTAIFGFLDYALSPSA